MGNATTHMFVKNSNIRKRSNFVTNRIFNADFTGFFPVNLTCVKELQADRVTYVSVSVMPPSK